MNNLLYDELFSKINLFEIDRSFALHVVGFEIALLQECGISFVFDSFCMRSEVSFI